MTYKHKVLRSETPLQEGDAKLAQLEKEGYRMTGVASNMEARAYPYELCSQITVHYYYFCKEVS